MRPPATDPGAALLLKTTAEDGGGWKTVALDAAAATMLMSAGGPKGNECVLCGDAGRFASGFEGTGKRAFYQALADGRVADAYLMLTLPKKLGVPADPAAFWRRDSASASASALRAQCRPGPLVSVARAALGRTALSLDHGRRRDLSEDDADRFATICSRLRQSDRTVPRKVFDKLPWASGDLLPRNADGRTAIPEDAERAFLSELLGRIVDHAGRTLTLPHPLDGGPPRSAGGWWPWAVSDPALRAYFDVKHHGELAAAARTGRLVQGMDPDGPLLTYKNGTPSDDSLFIADEGRRLVRVTIPDLTLRAYCLTVHEQVFLHDLLREDATAGGAPAGAAFVSHAARRLEEESIDGPRDRRAILAAFEGLACGMSHDSVLAYVGTVQSSPAASRDWVWACDSLFRRSMTGLGGHLEDRSFGLFAKACGAGFGGPFEKLLQASAPSTREESETAEFYFERLLVGQHDRAGRGDNRRERSELFRQLCDESSGSVKAAVKKFLHASPELAKAFRITPAGSLGLTGAPVWHTMARPAAVLLTRSEILAAAVCGLDRGGCGPAALIGDGVLCSVPDSPDPRKTAREAAEAGIRDFLRGPSWLARAATEEIAPGCA